MNDISPELRQELVARAKVHYPDVLPYHNWEHATDMMNIVSKLANKSIDSFIRSKANLLVVTAAWHDADYAIEDLGEYTTKEERSAALAVASLPELSRGDAQLLYDGIIDTTVAKHPKTNVFGEVTHVADVGYFASSSQHFMSRLALMREEWGSPDWETTVSRTVQFGGTVLEEAGAVMPKVLSDTDSDAWIARIESNLWNLQVQLESGQLK